MKKLLTILFFLPLFCNAGLFYASPTGAGTGTLASPFGLQTAIGSQRTPGDTIYLLAGTYNGTYTSVLTGNSTTPIIVMPNPGDRVIIDGSRAGQAIKFVDAITFNGAYTWFIGLEITNSDPIRAISVPGSNPPEGRGSGFFVNGVGVKVINCLIYDCGDGIGSWSTAVNSEHYGNIIFNNGWMAPDREHGHGIYAQNNTGTKRFEDNIILNNFQNGWQVYGSPNAFLNNLYFEGNVCFNDRWLMGGGGPILNMTLNSNYAYLNAPEFGYTSKLNDGLILRNNYFPSGAHLYWWKNVKSYKNTIFFYTGKSTPYDIIFEGPAGQPPDLTTLQSDSNTYAWSTTLSTNQFYYYWNNSTVPNGQPGKSGQIFLPAWKALGKDVNCTFNLYPPNGNALFLSGKKIFIRPNKYDANKFTVIIYNWDKSATVNVGSILNAGDQYELHNVQNYFGDVITGVYADSLIVPMTGHTVAKPLGYGLEIAPSTFPEFGAFVLIRKSGVVIPTPPIPPASDSLINAIQDQITALQGVISSINARIATLETSLSSLQIKVSNLKAITTIQ